jgi:predicted RNA polymerase sigma factor
MVRAYEHDDASTAQAASESLLRLYPSSSQAYQIKGEIARRSGRTQEAAAAFDRAVALIQSGADKLYLQHASLETVERTVQGLTRTSDSLRERKNQ